MLNTRWVKRRYKSYRQDETTNNRNPIICEKKNGTSEMPVRLMA